jgi:hypothetical protein
VRIEEPVKAKEAKPPVVEKPAPTPLPQRTVPVGTDFAKIGIDLGKMAPFEQMAVKMKLKRLSQLEEQNQKLEELIYKRHGMLEGTDMIPPDTPLLVKLFDDINKETTILRITSSDTADQVTAAVAAAIGRYCLLSIQTKKGRKAELTDENLQVAQKYMAMNDEPALFVLAL